MTESPSTTMDGQLTTTEGRLLLNIVSEDSTSRIAVVSVNV